ncbi:MAG: hypothetical protein ACKERG_00415 [Candidatus Hodgkinia cicadicola]
MLRNVVLVWGRGVGGGVWQEKRERRDGGVWRGKGGWRRKWLRMSMREKNNSRGLCSFSVQCESGGVIAVVLRQASPISGFVWCPSCSFWFALAVRGRKAVVLCVHLTKRRAVIESFRKGRRLVKGLSAFELLTRCGTCFKPAADVSMQECNVVR